VTKVKANEIAGEYRAISRWKRQLRWDLSEIGVEESQRP